MGVRWESSYLLVQCSCACCVAVSELQLPVSTFLSSFGVHFGETLPASIFSRVRAMLSAPTHKREQPGAQVMLRLEAVGEQGSGADRGRLAGALWVRPELPHAIGETGRDMDAEASGKTLLKQ